MTETFTRWGETERLRTREDARATPGPPARELRRGRAGPPRVGVDRTPEPPIERCARLRRTEKGDPCETTVAGVREARGGPAHRSYPLVRRTLDLDSSGGIHVQQNKLFVGNLAFSTTQEDVEGHFCVVRHS